MDRHGPHHNLLEVHPLHVPTFGSSGAESEVSYNLIFSTYFLTLVVVTLLLLAALTGSSLKMEKFKLR